MAAIRAAVEQREDSPGVKRDLTRVLLRAGLVAVFLAAVAAACVTFPPSEMVGTWRLQRPEDPGTRQMEISRFGQIETSYIQARVIPFGRPLTSEDAPIPNCSGRLENTDGQYSADLDCGIKGGRRALRLRPGRDANTLTVTERDSTTPDVPEEWKRVESGS